MSMSRKTVARLGIAARLAVEDPKAMTAAANAAKLRRFLAQVDEHAAATGEVLSPEERERRAHERMRCEMIRLSELAKAARNRNRAARKAGLKRRLNALETAHAR